MGGPEAGVRHGKVDGIQCEAGVLRELEAQQPMQGGSGLSHGIRVDGHSGFNLPAFLWNGRRIRR